jgi:hypothetical protein
VGYSRDRLAIFDSGLLRLLQMGTDGQPRTVIVCKTVGFVSQAFRRN